MAQGCFSDTAKHGSFGMLLNIGEARRFWILARKEVQVGQRYRAVGASFLGSPNARWVIDAIFTDGNSLRYARLVCINDPTLRKTLSFGVLMDRKRYLLDPDSAPEQPVM